MPARTNAFQKLVLHMQEQLAPEASVKESDFLHDLLTGTKREVDIVVRRSLAGHELLVCFECIEHGRPATVEWVDKMIGKHKTLPTDALVLVSASGFTEEATKKAMLSNVRLITLGDAVQTDWTSVVGKSEQLFLARFDFAVSRCAMLLVGNETAEYEVGPDFELANEDGQRRNTVQQCAEIAFHDPPIARQIMDRLADDGKRDGSFEITFPARVYATDTAGERHEVSRLRVSFTAERRTDPMALRRAAWNGTPVAYGEGKTSFGKTFLAISEPEPKKLRGLITLRDPASGSVKNFPFGSDQE